MNGYREKGGSATGQDAYADRASAVESLPQLT